MAHPQRKTTVVSKAVSEGLVVFDPQQQQSYVLNATSALVFQHCDGQTTPEQLSELLRRKFNVSHHQAEQLTWMALDELSQTNLLEATAVRPHPLSSALTRRQMLTAFATAGVALALVPMVAPVRVQAQAGHNLIPVLDCVVDNGDGTLTARFGYVNQSGGEIMLDVGPDNMFVPPPRDRGQPILFEPGTQTDVFEVTFDEGDTIRWLLKAPGDARHQVVASADSELCPPPTTTTTTAAPTTTTAEPGTTTTQTTTPPPEATTTTTTTTIAP